ncbi:hypothetical protein Pan181_53230 [Aeoliella mucimassa]|uniref:Uncharacterized protein n=1 Tax=Aeoliella mucimassa TaxID=2527972 RepID=A0A518AWH3_9BACT|nr:hypothetical protein Pan181_53230 [Aeoliella mucimassa]
MAPITLGAGLTAHREPRIVAEPATDGRGLSPAFPPIHWRTRSRHKLPILASFAACTRPSRGWLPAPKTIRKTAEAISIRLWTQPASPPLGCAPKSGKSIRGGFILGSTKSLVAVTTDYQSTYKHCSQVPQNHFAPPPFYWGQKPIPSTTNQLLSAYRIYTRTLSVYSRSGGHFPMKNVWIAEAQDGLAPSRRHRLAR